MSEEITLESLVGEHELFGVDFGTASPIYKWSDPSGTCVFVLDGVTYTVTEDADDGYRSYMRSIEKSTQPVSNRFPPCRVLCRMRTAYESGGAADVLEMIDQTTGKVVLTIGTENTDDYYPYCVMNFDPTAMAVNR